ncbi:MAG: hypothetical protein KGL35_04340 [Bradyrhizobium sp.]|nr:hypothetical protein [Bradyrhizobium sp.]
MLSKEEQKQILREALKEWLEEKYASVGKWTLRGIGALMLYALVMYLTSHGVKIQEIVKP